MKDTSAKLMLMPGGAERAGRLGAEKREGTATSARFVETMRYWIVCTKADIMDNWLPVNEFGGVILQPRKRCYVKTEVQVGRIRREQPIRMHFSAKAWGHG